MAGAGALARGPRPPSWEIGVSVVGHLLLAVVLLAAEALSGPPEPTFKPEDVTWIAAAPPPKAKGLPDKAMRTPDPPKGAKSDAPPPPPRASDMALPDPDAPKDKGEEKPEPTEDDAAARAKRRADLIKDMSAPIGPEDRAATATDGVEGEFAMVGAPGGIQDPVLIEYVEKCRAAIYPNWTPLPSTVAAHPEYSVGVVVKVMADGTLQSPQVVKKSGDAAFDRSGVMAVHKTRRFPPPPDKYARAAANGVLIELLARDKQ